MSDAPRPVRPAFTLIELLVVIAIVAVLIALLLPAVQAAREAARRSDCKSRLRQTGIALHNYHDVHRTFPPGWIDDNRWGWGTMLLPYLEQGNLYRTLSDDYDRFELPMSSDANTQSPLPQFRCPTDVGENLVEIDTGSLVVRYGRSNYVGVFGNVPIDDTSALNFDGAGGLFHRASSVRLRDVLDGTSQTIAVGERHAETSAGGVTRGGEAYWAGVFRENHWVKLHVGDCTPTSTINTEDPDGRQRGFSSLHTGGAQFVLADGSVRFLNESMSLQNYERLATIADGQVIDGF